MRRALVAAGLLAAIALSAGALCPAQSVAKLEVVKGSKDSLTQHQKLDRLDGKLDQVLELLRGKPPVVEPPPPPPVDPRPVDPPPPTADNPFTAWCASGSTIVDYILWRNGGIALSPAQEAQARAAGCFDPPKPGPGTGQVGPGFDRSGFALAESNGYLVHPKVDPGQPYTFTFPPGVGSTIAVFPVGGDQIDTVNGVVSPGGGRYPAVGGSITVNVTGVGRDGKIWLGVQLVP